MEDLEIRSRFAISACVVGQKIAENWKELNSTILDIESRAKDFERNTHSKIVTAVLDGSLKVRHYDTQDITTPIDENDLFINSRHYMIHYDELSTWWLEARKQLLPVKPPWTSQEDFNDISINNQAASQVKYGPRKQQHEIILAVIAILEFEPLKIPDGGKAKIKAICLKSPKSFTHASFDHAWKAGLGKNLFKLENAEKYKHPKCRQ